MSDSKVSKKVKQNDLIRHFEIIAKAAIKSNGNLETAAIPEDSLRKAGKFIELDRIPTILFSIIFILNFEDNKVDINSIAEYVKSNNLKIARYLREIENIEAKKLIRKFIYHRTNRDRHESLHDISYFITKNVLDAILLCDKSLTKSQEKVDMVTFLEKVNSLIEERNDADITYDEMIEEIDQLMNVNSELDLIRKVNYYKISDEERLLLLFVCRDTVNGDESVDLSRALGMIFEDATTKFRLKRDLIKGSSNLITYDILKLEDGFFRNDRDVLMTEHGLQDLFDKDMEVLINSKQKNNLLIAPDSIVVQPLFFNSEEGIKLANLTNMLQPDHFNKIKGILRKKKMNEGFTVLFHGSPGTGKTASVYDIAKKIGRRIMAVDISNTKSMWFGESEKKIKKVFDDYKKSRNNEIEPIMLFNECDAVFGTRKTVGSSSVDQTENAIQNIILQELEEFTGILIATTNLTNNLDRAFERRFLYKIRFSSPEIGIRKKIWLSKIPFLSDADASVLGEKYSFSGGNIENIARKTFMHEIIHGKAANRKDIEAYCNDELFDFTGNTQIGFRTDH
ncbi:MAG: ATP-binding protein [Candidatus Tenebribacter davisii]|nr:ATP-binding protein [Candidatus Tenebribacter davisii]